MYRHLHYSIHWKPATKHTLTRPSCHCFYFFHNNKNKQQHEKIQFIREMVHCAKMQYSLHGIRSGRRKIEMFWRSDLFSSALDSFIWTEWINLSHRNQRMESIWVKNVVRNTRREERMNGNGLKIDFSYRKTICALKIGWFDSIAFWLNAFPIFKWNG